MATREENLKKLNDELEKLSDEQLDNVAGGTVLESFGDGNNLYDRGLISYKDSRNLAKISEVLHNLGYKYENHAAKNEYFNKKGVSVKRDDFWKKFDAENGTKIIR